MIETYNCEEYAVILTLLSEIAIGNGNLNTIFTWNLPISGLISVVVLTLLHKGRRGLKSHKTPRATDINKEKITMCCRIPIRIELYFSLYQYSFRYSGVNFV